MKVSVDADGTLHLSFTWEEQGDLMLALRGDASPMNPIREAISEARVEYAERCAKKALERRNA